ncbi:hypothetical protein K469DRAFT_563071 [Zopfia rhizophila CBS 207.26]|uniref:Uncharacterized protein n=1 Tax=Zopfia rhizophila CBS 207.26 TaxID=1314779 RepID=A0A6A6EH50_9PEZI|nr:hypothetical protein K469DRAFT_563071 [Zopfia rhizophila CBS 207.26]
MAATENDRPPNGYAKEWNRRFLEDQDFKEDGSFVELRKLVDADGDDLDVFLREYEGPVPDCAVALIKEFCSSINPNLLQTESTQTQRGAWLDDRDSHGGFRTYLNPIGPKELYGHLKQLRFECPGACDAARRLIYISNLNPYYILALAKTASEYQVSVLKDTIWKHLTLQASVRVEIPRGFPIFRLECHIPYLALRTSTMPSTESILAGVETKPRRKWFDLSFLKTSHPKELEKQRIGVYEAQISVVTCGSDKSKWATYAFVDTEFDGEPLEEGDFDYEGMHEDPIVSESDGQINANHPIQDAREYFLLVVEKRMAQVHREWKYLVQKVEESIEKFVCSHRLKLGPSNFNIER